MLSRCNFNDIEVITDFETAGTTSFGNIIATMQTNRNNDKFYFLRNNTINEIRLQCQYF